MRCYNCGNYYTKASGIVNFKDDQLGSYAINLEEYYICSCGNKLFPDKTLRHIEEVEKSLEYVYKKKDKIFTKHPIID